LDTSSYDGTTGTISAVVVLHTDTPATVSGFQIGLDLVAIDPTGGSAQVIGAGLPIGFSGGSQPTAPTSPNYSYVFDGSPGSHFYFNQVGAIQTSSSLSPSVSFGDLLYDDNTFGLLPATVKPGDYAVGVIQVAVQQGTTPGVYGISVTQDPNLTNISDDQGNLLAMTLPQGPSLFTVNPQGPTTATPAPPSAVLFGLGSVLFGVLGAARNRFRSCVQGEASVAA
jgi:hypothetical protein